MRSFLARSLAGVASAGLAAMLVLGGSNAASAAELPEPEIVTGAPVDASFPIVYDGSLWIRGGTGTTSVWFSSTDGVTYTEVAGSPEGVFTPVVLDGVLYFGTFDEEVWQYTPADGFELVEAIDTLGDMVALDGVLYASARETPGDPYLLYAYTPGGAFTLIASPNASDSQPHGLFVLSGKLHVLFFSGGNIETLYQLDGTTLTPVVMPAPGGGGSDIRLIGSTAIDGDTWYAVITTADFSSGVLYTYELGGALTEVAGPLPWTKAGEVVAYNGTIYVVNRDDGMLYQSSGGAFTAVPDAPLYLGDSGYVFEGFLLANGQVGSDDQLFAFDGTSFGDPFAVFDARGFIEFNSALYFFGAADPEADSALWRFDLSPADDSGAEPELADTGTSDLTLAGGVAAAVLLVGGAALLTASRRRAVD